MLAVVAWDREAAVVVVVEGNLLPEEDMAGEGNLLDYLVQDRGEHSLEVAWVWRTLEVVH